MRRSSKAGWWSAGVIVLALVFASYLRRDFVFDLANQVWSCF